MIFWIFPIVPCHAFCMWHWPIGKNLDSSFIWGHHHLIVSIWISVYQLNTSYSLLRRTYETQQGRNSCLRLQMLASVWTLSCHCPVKLLTQYQPCIIVCYSNYNFFSYTIFFLLLLLLCFMFIKFNNLVPRAFSSTIFKMADRREKTLAKAGITWYKISKNLGDFYHVTFWESQNKMAAKGKQNTGQRTL